MIPLNFEWDENKNVLNQKQRINMNENNIKASIMRKFYDFSNSVKNPYIKPSKQQITLEVDEETINYFKALAVEKGTSYQSLINLYLHECATTHQVSS